MRDEKRQRSCRVEDPQVLTKHTVVAKLSSYKDKQKILSKCNCLKGTGTYINKDFLKETLEIRKHNRYTVKALCKQGKYVILVYDCIHAR